MKTVTGLRYEEANVKWNAKGAKMQIGGALLQKAYPKMT